MDVPFNEETERRIENGELVPLALFLYEPAREHLLIHGLGPVSLAEAMSMLRKYIDGIPAPTPDDE